MSDSEQEQAIASEDEIDSDFEEDIYEEAIERYAQMLREVPQAKLDGIIERVEELFTNPDINQQLINDEIHNETVVLMILLAVFMLLMSIIIRGIMNSKNELLLNN